MCFIWPTLEALVSESETPAGVPRAVGIYNIVWAVTNALAFFIGGTLVEKFGFKSIFYLPLAIVLAQLALTFWLQNHANETARAAAGETIAAPPPDPNRPSPARAKTFLRMSWLANPFAYIAINTLIAVTPGLAAKFHVSPMFAGFVWSLWCFVRLGAFVVLWRWTDWHYRFRWLAASFAILILSFATILLSPNLIVLIVAQIFFGGAIGLIYYSSLFYSMDGGDGEKRARRHPRGGHRPGQLRRPGDRRGGAAMRAAIREQRRDCRKRAAAGRLRRVAGDLENGE